MLPINKKISLINWTDRNTTPKYIVIHYVGAVSTAKNNADYFYKEYRAASAHYFVDENSIWQVVEDNDSAWGVGGGRQSNKGGSMYGIIKNSNSISIEMCVKKDAKGNWYYEQETLNNTRDLVLYLMAKYNIPSGNVYRHFDVTGKYCPANYLTDSTWATLKSFLTTKPVNVEPYGGYVEVLYGGSDGLDIHSKPTFTGSVVKVAKKGEVFQVVGKIKVNGVYMYKLSDGNYITSATKYVKYTTANPKPTPTPKPSTPTYKYVIGDVVTINGVYTNSNSETKLKPSKTKGTITNIYKNTKNPYLLDNGDIGFVNDACIVGKANSATKPVAKDLNAVAKKVYNGDYGNGQARTNKLKAEGYTDAEIKQIQQLVNKMCK